MYVKCKTLCFVYHKNMSSLGENLKELRKIHHISQKDFATQMQTTQQRVSEWECNKVEPSLYNIVKILKIYDITFEELIEGIEM